MRWRRALFSLLLVVGILFVGRMLMNGLLARRRPPVQAEAEVSAVAVRVRPLVAENYREQLIGYGRARALRRAHVAAEVAGVVRWVAKELEAGALVTVGTELIRLDERDLKTAKAGVVARKARNRAEARSLASELATNAAKITIAADELDLAQRELQRVKDMGAAATPSELDRERLRVTVRRTAVLDLQGRARTLAVQVEGNTAEFQEITAQELRATTDVERAKISAPFTGQIQSRMVDQHDRVGIGALLFELIDPSQVEIPISLPGSRFGEVQVGDVASVTFAGTAREWNVARIGPSVRSEDRTFVVYLTREGGTIPPGAFVSARVGGRMHADVFVIPRTALMGEQCFIAMNGVARGRTPPIEHALAHAVLVRSGVKAGERLIVTNLEEIADGTKVHALAEEQPR